MPKELLLPLQDFEGHDSYVPFLEFVGRHMPEGALILEGGTWSGTGARALGCRNHRVWTYDPYPQPGIEDGHRRGLLTDNITWEPRKVLDIPIPQLLACDLFYLDIDPHAGTEEIEFYDHLKKVGFTGLLVCDDIAMNDGMRRFWDHIDLPKFTTGQRAHLTGMGVVSFSERAKVTE